MATPQSQIAAQPRSANDDADTSSFFEDDERPTWRKKAGRFVKVLKRTKNQARRTDATDMTMSVGGSPPSGVPSAPDVGDNNNDGAPSASSSSPPTQRRRRYINGWVRYPGKNSSNPSSITAPPSKIKDAYRIAIKDKFVRKHLVVCAVSGLLLLMMISLYLVYAINFTTIDGQTYHIFFILLIMILAMVFCHSFARTCLLATKIARYGSTGLHRIPSVVGPLGYAQPAQPIHVVLARDEEIVIEGAAADANNNNPSAVTGTKLTPPPPAYGLWRSSVRINPNLLYWQRVESAPKPETSPQANNSQTSTSNSESSSSSSSSTSTAATTTATTSTTTESNQPRPPSYASDDGVGYVVHAQPRITISHYSPPPAKHG
ncbi:conserved hypothetical protein [Talaromyces stipitatus ATCC 10500]|uniref:Uncharacterized protein n=1 Tax=Talaromyces stipitatus (strain ATCC 10500 / CBS 375.48 / QM 6759 / NRRL 1006) TaxID=441959 RepID=B8MU02_TALSN|nr:uncharacterized protein TSTA_006550 [Talaromyces stipitatus ATCC 10500]EED12635.1 conserved hypothetical protein [Talaromyces stipitatus ATCC 10500]